MADTTSNNKRIAKNTILLYFRMIVTTVVSLYTARLVLELLGVADFGIFNVVAGLTGFMTVITATMTSATQRFLSFDLGRGDVHQYKCTYSMFIDVFAIFCILAVVIMEIVGPYCINNYLVIPPDRLYATQWLFQFTIVNFVLTTMTIPQTSSIVAYEKMDVYAYITFLDVFFKLLAVFALYYTPIDRLITYGIAVTLLQVVTYVLLLVYSHCKLEGCQYLRCWDNTLFHRLSAYAGWNLVGSLSGVLVTYGQTVILNLFFGPVVNAAKAIADKINTIVVSFSNNFYMAVSPQIIKSYAAGDTDYTRRLVLCTSRYSFMLLAVLSFPLIFNMSQLLQLWLGEAFVSEEMVIFSQLQLLCSMTLVLETPVTMAVRATGNIKKYQICIGAQTLLFIPLCYVAFMLGMPAYCSMIVLIATMFIAQFSRVYLVGPVINTTIIEYSIAVLLPSAVVVALVAGLYYVALLYIPFSDNLTGMVSNIFFSFLLTAMVISFVGLRKSERRTVFSIIKKRFRQ